MIFVLMEPPIMELSAGHCAGLPGTYRRLSANPVCEAEAEQVTQSEDVIGEVGGIEVNSSRRGIVEECSEYEGFQDTFGTP
jgi:hypothetical protein